MPDDPYRTLGLDRGASLDQVKRAYRRLVKANHPDAAGEAALPRFLAIQAAYDQIAGPDASARGTVGRGAPGAPRGAWDADTDRAGATYRAYGGRPRPRPGPRPRPRPRSSPRTDGPTRTGRPGAAGPDGAARDPDDPGQRRPKKATLGSTSYDDVDPERFEPDWGGASWYGTTSGTYWTLNPKEYADPRKHGPEYQARARRARQDRDEDAPSVAPDSASARVAETAPPSSGPSIGVDASGAAAGPPPPTHTTSSWWEATTAEPATSSSAAGGRRPPGAAPRPAASRTSPPPARSIGFDEPVADLSSDAVIASIRGWLDDPHPTGVARIGRAVIGWAPIALGAGWFVGEVTGCSRFAATCPPAVAPLTWVAQLGLLVMLILLPRLARVATIGTIAILGTVFPASLLLFATGDPESMATGRSILGGLMILAWLAGLGYGIAREVRRGASPVS
jgi:DnaJ domain